MTRDREYGWESRTCAAVVRSIQTATFDCLLEGKLLEGHRNISVPIETKWPYVMKERRMKAVNKSKTKRTNHRQQTCSNNFTHRIHRYTQIHTHCGIDSNRGDEWHYLLQKLLQLNSKLWSIAITSFDQYLLFNRPVVYVAHSIFFPFLSSRSPSSSVATFSYLPSNAMGFSCSFWQWVHFDLSVAIENVRFPRRWHRKKSFCDVENGHRINCMRVTRYAIASNE